jgi:hypothetical protein
MSSILWKEETQKIKELLSKGNTIEEIGEFYGVSKQRIYQVMTKFGLKTSLRERKNFLVDKEPKYYWFNKMLTTKQIPIEERRILLEDIDIPDNCPMLGIQLNYDGVIGEGWTRKDNSPSLDRKDNSKGYTKDNIHIISWRANRIKNDSTPEELMSIANYMYKLTKNTLQL